MTFDNGSEQASDLTLRSSAFPGGSLLNAIYDRTFMQYSDRGGASGIIGDRWADLCAVALTEHPGIITPVEPGGRRITHDTVVRLDDVPEIARVASRAQLQNPDFLLLGTSDHRQTIRAADAKFSIETAKSRQVSADVLRALLDPLQAVRGALPELREDAVVSDGIFLCPDYSLTRFLLRGQQGVRRITVPNREICLLPVTVAEFMRPIGHERLIDIFAARDNLEIDYRQSLLLTLFYFRLARAAAGFRIDQTRPLLGSGDAPTHDLDEVEVEAERIGRHAFGAWNLLLRWNDIADEVRQQRIAVDQATGFPIPGKVLRQRIEQCSLAAGVAPPSTNRVRRMAGAWMRARLREEFGPIPPPVEDMDALLRQLRAYSRALMPEVSAYTDSVIQDLIVEQPPAEEPRTSALA